MISAVWATPKVDRGVTVGLSEHPFVVQIFVNGRFENLGTLVSDDLVITSSANIINFRTTEAYGEVEVKSSVGSHNNRYRTVRNVKLAGCGSIAILELRRPFDLEDERIKTVELIEADRVKANSKGEILNWNEDYDDRDLQSVEIHGIKKKCGIYQKKYKEDEAICGYDCIPPLKDKDLAVNGAPYLIGGKQAGLVISESSDNQELRVKIKTFVKLSKSDKGAYSL